jgi:transposase
VILGVKLMDLSLKMFVRSIKNKNGKTYVQVIDKSTGKYKVLHHVGNSADKDEIEQLIKSGQLWMKSKTGSRELDFSNEAQWVERVMESIQSLELVGLELLLGRLFDEIGFNAIKDELFRQLVIYRIAFPKSKLKTTEYLYRYRHLYWSEDQIYHYLDKLYHTQKEKVQQISYQHTLQILHNDISIVFYDVTTLYFEIDQEDELRKTGFSKEGKHQHPQIVLGLLVSKNGYPLAYEIFNGNKFEGHTMLPVIEAFKNKYNLGKLVIIADAGLLSQANIDELEQKQYEFIIGARIKNEGREIQQQILALELKNGQSAVIEKETMRLIITYTDSRAKKDKYNREKGVRKLEKQIKKGSLTKSNLNRRGYNKFLRLEGELTITIDSEKLEQDQKWDGLKGYLSNARLDKDEIIENYRHLWQIEKAFRVSKTELKIRPIYHRLPRRIEAHICLSFVAYKVYKELERQLELKQATISTQQAIEIAENIFEIQMETPTSKVKLKKLLLLTEEQKYLAQLFKF